jgi:hypothetical protein
MFDDRPIMYGGSGLTRFPGDKRPASWVWTLGIITACFVAYKPPLLEASPPPLPSSYSTLLWGCCSDESLIAATSQEHCESLGGKWRRYLPTSPIDPCKQPQDAGD